MAQGQSHYPMVDDSSVCSNVFGQETEPHIAPGGQARTLQGSCCNLCMNVFVNVNEKLL